MSFRNSAPSFPSFEVFLRVPPFV